MKILTLLLSLTACVASSYAGASDAELRSAKNSAARAVALAQIAGDEGAVERAHVELLLGKFKSLGVEVGPFCFQMAKGCVTQSMLGYRSSEYYSLGELKNIPKAGIYTSIYGIRFHTSEEQARFRKVAEENGVTELALVHALELKEKLEMAYLEAYLKAHPNTPTRHDNTASSVYSWKISADGEVYEDVSVSGNAD